MARVTTKADLTEGTEYDIDLANKRVTLNVAGNLEDGSANGVDIDALYSSISDFWKSDSNANRYRWPFDFVDGPIGSMLEFRDGWEFTTPTAQWQASTAYSLGDYVVQTSDNSTKYGADVIFECTVAGTSAGSEPTFNTTINGTVVDSGVTWTTRRASKNLIRNGGFAYKNTSGTITAEFACFVQLGTVKTATDQPYYLITGTAPTNFSVPDEFHECIHIYGDSTHDNFDYRSPSVTQFFVRTAGDTYMAYDLLTQQSISTLTYRSYSIPGSTSTDTSISVTGPSGVPYSGMTLTLGATTNTINSTVYNFAEGEIDANGGTVQQVYDWFQDLLLSTSDIDSGAGTQRGDTYLDGTLSLVGGIITTSQGLTIKNIASADASNIIHVDDTGTGRQELFVPSLTVNCVDANGSPANFATGTRVQLYNSGGASASAWAATTAYVLGDKVLRSTGVGTEDGAGGTGAGLWFECTVAGTTGGSEPTWPTTEGNTVVDGTVTWTCQVIELYNAQPGAVSSISVNYASGALADSLIRERDIAVNGTTNASKFSQATFTATSTNVAISVTQETNSIYEDNLEDGSNITECTISSNGIDVEVNDASNATTFQRIYAFYQDYLASQAGIRDSSDLIVANTQTDYTFDDTVEIKNIKTGSPLSITGANAVDGSGDPIGVLDTTGETIFVNAKTVVPFNYVSGSGVTAQDKIDIANQTLATAVEGTHTLQGWLSLIGSALFGKTTGVGTTNETFRDLADSKDRLDVTYDGSNNRSSVTLDSS